jgi:zinc D-Ala-D-Ala carboxypeptidase
MPDQRLGSFFWLSEFLRSDTATRKGLANVPGPAELANIRRPLAAGMERVRNLLGVPVHITSGYRSPEVNAAVGGTSTSQHCQGLAADFIAPDFGTPRSIASYLMQHLPDLRFDQLIFEGTWVHISFVNDKPRGEVLTAHFVPGQAVSYSRGVA